MERRLKTQKDFSSVFKKGKRLFSSSLTLVYLSADAFKVGYAVSKRHGGSVKRNRIKRLLREAFRSFACDISGNFFFVFIPKEKEEYSLAVFLKDMKYLLKKGGFLKNPQTAKTDGQNDKNYDYCCADADKC